MERIFGLEEKRGVVLLVLDGDWDEIFEVEVLNPMKAVLGALPNDLKPTSEISPNILEIISQGIQGFN